MSHEKITEDLNTSVGELSHLLNNTFVCCMRNYEALLPYLEKKESKLKMYHKLVQINTLLDKLNEELVELVDYANLATYEQKRKTSLSEESKKRKTSDELSRHETKSMKMELSISSNTKCTDGSSEMGINMQSDNLLSMDTEETQVQEPDMHIVKNIKREIRDSYEMEDFSEFPIGKSDIPETQTSCNIMKKSATVHFVGGEESASVADRIVGGNAYSKTPDTVTQREGYVECVPLQNVKTQTSKQEKCETSGQVVSKDNDIYEGLRGKTGCASSFSYQKCMPFKSEDPPVAFTTDSAVLSEVITGSGNKKNKRPPHSPVRCKNNHVNNKIVEKPSSEEGDLYGVMRHENGIFFKCTLCNRPKIYDSNSMLGHVKGKQHRKNVETARKKGYAVKPDVSAICENTVSVSTLATTSCSLADNLVIVENSCQLGPMKGTVKLDDMWKYFPTLVHINKNYFRILSNQVICSLCNERIGGSVLDVKAHISRYSHLHRINVLTNIELENMSSNQQLLNIPGILKNIIPRAQFSLINNGFDGFFCSVCQCVCENEVVLSHMTGARHCLKLGDMKQINVEIITITKNQCKPNNCKPNNVKKLKQ